MHKHPTRYDARPFASERGGALVFLSVTLVPLIALLALCVDGFSLLASKLEQENNSEYAALAALNDGIDPVTGLLILNRESARMKRAELVAGRNLYIGNRAVKPVTMNDIASKRAGKMTFGYYNKNTKRFTASGECLPGGKLALNAIRLSLNTVEASSARPSSAMLPLFSRVLGYKSFSMESASIVYYDKDRKLSASAAPGSASAVRSTYDVNGDGTVDKTDLKLLSEALGSDTATTNGSSLPALGKECYDLDGNSTVNLSDFVKLQSYLNDKSNRS